MVAFKSGWMPDRPDFRDWWYDITALLRPKPLKATVDLRADLPEVWDQGNIGSCVAQSVAALLEYNRRQEKKDSFTPSRLFIYFNAREKEGTIPVDAGCYIRTAIKSVASQGAAHETLWPYDVTQFKKRPVKTVYNDALQFKALSYYRLENSDIEVLKRCLAEGECFAFGSSIYSSFLKAADTGGVVPMPDLAEENLGGHAMLCCGYTKKHFIIRNSWGPEAGEKGYFYMPHAYLTNKNLTDDCWTIRSTT